MAGIKGLSALERFLMKVSIGEGCWLWTAARFPNGYGLFAISRRRPIGAHRFSWELAYGPVPEDRYVCHICDVKACVRPSHLFLGTPADNTQDALGKGLMPTGARHWSRLHPERFAKTSEAFLSVRVNYRGEQHGRAKLRESDVLAIRSAYAAGGITYEALATQYGVSRAMIRCIVKRWNWTHV